MTTATRMLLVSARSPEDAHKTPAALGILTKKADGWHFNPLVASHRPSRAGKPTWEKAIPRWTGGINGTESRRMDPGETVADVLKKFSAPA